MKEGLRSSEKGSLEKIQGTKWMGLLDRIVQLQKKEEVAGDSPIKIRKLISHDFLCNGANHVVCCMHLTYIKCNIAFK